MSSDIRYIDTNARSKILCIRNIYFLTVITISVLISLVIGLLLYQSLPDPVTLQWGLNLEAARMTAKTQKLIYFIPIIQIVNGLIITMCNVVIKKSKLSLVRASEEDLKNIIEKKFLLSKLAFFTALMVEFMYVFVQLIIFTQDLRYLILIILLLTIMAIIIGYYVMKIPKIVYPKFDYGWKNKYLYFNREDASIFVEKHSGIGYTINFANKIGVCIFVCTMLTVIGLIVGSILLIK